MKRILGRRHAIALCAVLSLTAICQAQIPEMPKPTKEHELLSQFAGEWKMTAETVAAPGQEPIKCTGVESSKMVGGFWLVGQSESSMFGTPVNSVVTVGYDPAKKKYIGTFLCSMDSTLWKYEGMMDDAGKKLTLETEGPSPLGDGTTARFREILELKDKDHKVFTSYLQTGDGEWMKIVTMEYRRKKAS